MKNALLLGLGLLALLTVVALAEPKVYRDRWVFAGSSLESDQQEAQM